MDLDNIDGLNIKNASPFPTALRYGMIGGLLVIVVGLIQYLIGIASQASQAIGWLSMLIIVISPILAIREHRDNDLDGYISYGRCLGVGVLTTLVISLIGLAWGLILYNVIDPNIMSTIMEAQMEAMAEAGMSDDDIENTMEMISQFMTSRVIMIAGTVMSLVLGFFTSLIAGVAFKKDREFA